MTIFDVLDKEAEEYTDEQLDFYRKEMDRCWPWLKEAMQTYGETHTKDDLWDMLVNGNSQLWPLPNAVMFTNVDSYPTGLKELRGWLAGGDLRELVAFEPIVAAWAKSVGCSRSVICGRRGWLKAFKNYRDVGTVIIKEF